MQDEDVVMAMRHSRTDLDARLRMAVTRHAARRGVPPERVVSAIERFLEQPAPGRDTRLGELRHRVKNEMQLLSSTMRRRRGAMDASDRGRCDACIGQVAALAQLNAAVDDGPVSGAGEVDLGQQALNFASALRSALGLDTGATRLDIGAEPIFVPRKVARNLLLIMNEAVTNAAKHGAGRNGGTIRIALEAVSRDAAQLTVCNETTDACGSREGGRGRSLIDALAAGIGGDVVRETAARSFRLTCRFPLSRSRSGLIVR